MFLALLTIHFNPRYARAKMVLSRAKNIFMPQTSTLLLYYLTALKTKSWFNLINRYLFIATLVLCGTLGFYPNNVRLQKD